MYDWLDLVDIHKMGEASGFGHGVGAGVLRVVVIIVDLVEVDSAVSGNGARAAASRIKPPLGTYSDWSTYRLHSALDLRFQFLLQQKM